MMEFLEDIKRMKEKPEFMKILLLLPIIALILAAIPAMMFVDPDFSDGPVMDALLEARSLQRVALEAPWVRSNIWGKMSEEDFFETYSGAMFSPGFIGLTYDEGRGFDIDFEEIDEGDWEPDCDDEDGWCFYGDSTRQLKYLVEWGVRIVWAMLGILFIMGMTRTMYAGKYSLKQFKAVFSKRNIALAILVPLLVFQVGVWFPGGLGFALAFLLGILFFMLIPFLSVDNSLKVSLLLAFRRLVSPESYTIIALVIVFVFIASLILGGIVDFGLRMLVRGELRSVSSFIFKSLLLMAAIAIQAIGANSLLHGAGEDPKTKEILETVEKAKRESKKTPEDHVAAARGRLPELRAKGLSKLEIKSEFRAMRLSIKEIEELL